MSHVLQSGAKYPKFPKLGACRVSTWDPLTEAWRRHLAFWPEAGRRCPYPKWHPQGAWPVMASPSAMAAAVDPIWEDLEEEEEELEEEQFVLVELSGIIDSDFLSKCENKCKILGIDTERPIMQVDSYVFAGEYEDTLGTCVIFEEGVERVDPEGTDKTVLKYKCHTMKKLSMTRTLLTEKKEGEENIDGVEWLQMKDNDFSYRPNMICSFLHEHEDEAAGPASDKPVELEDQESQMKGSAEQTQEQEKVEHSEVEDPAPSGETPSEMESSVFMGTQDGNVSQNNQS